ncbi:hypothetical protein DFH08DRAFT_722883 [Mycena albidolilacea]|uniref:Uncharacterized protein n=1 Tax=Mycena albidolilacea TaxID=1033008 RepID=A0AAD6Z171_9AGAR|nr:hypothetical protein DFH08DRAFT_722883 [Mycena albidolilacea]
MLRRWGYIRIPHDWEPENKFEQDRQVLPLIYATLFPYGIGGPNNSKCTIPLSLKHHGKHLLNLSDIRFQEHPWFIHLTYYRGMRCCCILD